MRHLVHFVLVFAAILVSGCASTKLTLNLDLYDDEPTLIIPLTPTKVANLYGALDAADAEAEGWASDHKALADGLFQTYEELSHFNTVMRGQRWNRGVLVGLEAQLGRHKQAVDVKSANVKSLTNIARGDLSTYLTIADGSSQSASKQQVPSRLAAQTVALNSMNHVYRALMQLSGPLNTDFEKSLSDNWKDVADTLRLGRLPELVKKRAGVQQQFDSLKEKIGDLAATIQQVAKRNGRLPTEVAKTIGDASQALDSKDPSQLQKSINAIAKVATDIPASLQLGDRGRTALNELTLSTTLLYSQVDRLQDPADPMWRVVTAPANEPKWNTRFSETYFYSEGNNSVVAVRDTPMSFRVQQGNNNPSALIEGQLQISRAIANTAIAIAGASMGVIPSPSGSANPPAPAPDTKSSDPTIAKAKVEREASLRAQALRNLRGNLAALRDEFAKLPADDAKAEDPQKAKSDRQALLRRFQSVLQGHQPLFSAPADQPK